jgi:tetratricopeptide (TPR) repeat protein
MADYQAAVKRRFEAAAGSAHPHEPLGLEKVQEEVLGLSLELLNHRGLTAAPPLLKLFACLNIALIPYPALLAEEVLAGSSLLPGFTVAESSLLPGFTAAQRKVLDGLAELGLIELQVLDNVEDPRLSYVLSLHPVVHGILRDDVDVRRRRAEYFGLNIQMLLAATKDFDPDYPSNWPVWNLVVPHAVEVAETTLLGGDRLTDMRVITSALELARLTCRYLIVAGLIRPATKLLYPAIDQCELFGFSANAKEILGLRHEKGRIDLERGDPAAAERELALVVAGRRQILGENHRDTLASRHKLARAILEQGRWAEAEVMLTSIVAAEHYVRGPEHSDTMVVRHSLARAILYQGRYGEAEAKLREILEIRYREFPRATPETLFVRQTLATSMLEQKDKRKWREAEAELDGALSEMANRLDLPVVMLLRHCRALAVLQLGRVPEAADDLAKLLADRKRVLGDSHPETKRTGQLLVRARSILDNPP